MIAHVILFEPRPSLTAGERESIVAALEAAVRGAPTVRACRVGRRVTHGLPGYEQLMTARFEFVVIIEFDDLDGLRAYLQHPAHAAIGAHFSSAAATALAYDFEMVDSTDARALLRI